MTTADFMLLCADLETLASEVFNDEKEPCWFEDDEQVVEFEQEFNIFEGRD